MCVACTQEELRPLSCCCWGRDIPDLKVTQTPKSRSSPSLPIPDKLDSSLSPTTVSSNLPPPKSVIDLSVLSPNLFHYLRPAQVTRCLLSFTGPPIRHTLFLLWVIVIHEQRPLYGSHHSLLYIYLWIRAACVKELLSLLGRKQVKVGTM